MPEIVIPETWNHRVKQLLRRKVKEYGCKFTHSSVTGFEWWLIYRTLVTNQYKKAIEIGCFNHCSTLAFAEAAKSIDGFQLTTMDITYRNTIDIPWVKWNKLQGKSQDLFEQVKGKVDFVFIDGDHSAQGVQADIINAKRVLKVNGQIFLHDLNSLFNDKFGRAKRGPIIWKAITDIIPAEQWSFFPDPRSSSHGLAVYSPKISFDKIGLSNKRQPETYDTLSIRKDIWNTHEQ